MPTIYAILVGINHYKFSKDLSLKHTITDVWAIHDFLMNLKNGYRVDLYKDKPLTDSEATKDKVTEAFCHFEQARGEDICLFYFSGHGSQLGKIPAELRHLKDGQGGKFETMVMHDSRCGVDDFVDKELAYLINKNTRNSAFRGKGHVAIISDCCHSGNGARLDNNGISGRKTLIETKY